MRVDMLIQNNSFRETIGNRKHVHFEAPSDFIYFFSKKNINFNKTL